MEKNTKKLDTFCSIDPGIRTFATCYSPQSVMEFGKNDIKRIERLHGHVDTMISYSKHVKSKECRKILKNAHKLRLKIRNLVKELHWKVSKVLCTKFKNIFIPIFETSKMGKRFDNPSKQRLIGKTTVRNMSTWSHYLFRSRLIHQAKKYNCNVYTVNEAYTSKTCSNCGLINEKLGSSKTFKCNGCKIEIDRDINGARGIYLRQMSLGGK
jgi:putative transposase